MAPGDSTSLWSLYFLPGENCLEGGGNSSQVSQNRDLFSGMSLYDNLRLGGILEKDKKKLEENFQRVYQWFPLLREREKQAAGPLVGVNNKCWL